MSSNDDSFDTNKVNQASIASELDFNFENADLTSSDQDVDDVDMEKVVKLEDLRLGIRSKDGWLKGGSGSTPRKLDKMMSKLQQAKKQPTSLIERLDMGDASFKQRVMQRIMQNPINQQHLLAVNGQPYY